MAFREWQVIQDYRRIVEMAARGSHELLTFGNLPVTRPLSSTDVRTTLPFPAGFKIVHSHSGCPARRSALPPIDHLSKHSKAAYDRCSNVEGRSMRRVNLAVLKKGDIILSTSTKFPSAVVRVGTFSDISHAMLYVAHGSVIDSTGEGVHARNIEKLLYDDKCPLYVLRLISELTPEQLSGIVRFVRQATGTTYAKIEATLAATKGMPVKGRKQFCSRLVAEAYASVGIALYSSPSYCSPENLWKSDLLGKVPNAIVCVTDEQIAALEEDRTSGMRSVTNAFLDAVRNIAPVEALNDVNALLIERPAIDPQVAQLLRESGYLDYYKLELKAHPYRYTIECMAAEFDARRRADADDRELIDYCEATLAADAGGDFQHWHDSMNGYQDLVETFPEITTFELFKELYWALIRMHAVRVTTAKTFLKWQQALINHSGARP